ncbi:hypothetical protein ACFOOQ_03945 [Ferrovibrio xuzhouensis]|uniref:Uncharacterized protein n=1 Tax=Ferrovibrio xuzhouensis TaxID=1576914 RepID=A0ABV7VD12_9PROT
MTATAHDILSETAARLGAMELVLEEVLAALLQVTPMPERLAAQATARARRTAIGMRRAGTGDAAVALALEDQVARITRNLLVRVQSPDGPRPAGLGRDRK